MNLTGQSSLCAHDTEAETFGDDARGDRGVEASTSDGGLRTLRAQPRERSGSSQAQRLRQVSRHRERFTCQTNQYMALLSRCSGPAGCAGSFCAAFVVVETKLSDIAVLPADFRRGVHQQYCSHFLAMTLGCSQWTRLRWPARCAWDTCRAPLVVATSNHEHQVEAIMPCSQRATEVLRRSWSTTGALVCCAGDWSWI